MKIQINDEVRDMTQEEEAAYWEYHQNLPPISDDHDKAEAYDILTGVTP